MLGEEEVRDRARYCYCVFRQLGWLYGRHDIAPAEYLVSLKGSCLGLADDDFITMTLEEAYRTETAEEGLRTLLVLYEGFTHAYCEVLEIDMASLEGEIEPAFLKRLAEEMGAKERGRAPLPAGEEGI